jgi:hypothetical protein
MSRLAAAVTVLYLAALASRPLVAASLPAMPPQWKNCSAVNKHYAHGVGRDNAHDKTSGTPVTNFKRSTKLYSLAMSYNRSLDRDHDGIACEKS